MALTTKKKRATEQATQQQTEEQEVAALLSAFESTRPVEEHSFEAPAVIPDELREAYEEHKKKLGDYTPWAPPVSREEDELTFARINGIGRKSDRLSPAKNPELLPEKEIIKED